MAWFLDVEMEMELSMRGDLALELGDGEDGLGTSGGATEKVNADGFEIWVWTTVVACYIRCLLS